jgi:hypothetical protein
MRFKPMGALRAQKAYSDVLGKKGSLFFSWTFVNRQHLLLVLINGELPEARALKYKAALAACSPSGDRGRRHGPGRTGRHRVAQAQDRRIQAPAYRSRPKASAG